MQASGETAAHQTATRKLPAPRGNNEASDVDRLEQTYRRITRRVHPDWSGRFPSGGSRVAHNGVMTISDAYDCLSDLALRCPIVGRVTDPDALLGNPGARLASADDSLPSFSDDSLASPPSASPMSENRKSIKRARPRECTLICHER